MFVYDGVFTAVMPEIHKLYPAAAYPKDDLLNWFWISIGSAWEPTLFSEVTPQKQRKILSGSSPAYIIDAISNVPFIRERGKNPQEIAATLLAKSDDEWQREIDMGRAEIIGDWWDDADSQMLNPVVLRMIDGLDPFDEPEESLVCPLTGSKKFFQPIKFEPWQQDKCDRCNQHFKKVVSTDPEYKVRVEEIFADLNQKYDEDIPIFTDQCINKNCPDYSKQINSRPLQIADGQHRIRGTQTDNAEDYCEVPILYAIMPPRPGSNPSAVGFTKGDSGKIFTDINVRAKGLVPNHKINMAWRFGITEAKVWGESTFDFTPGSRAFNSYEAILHLTKGTQATNLKDNPFYGKVYTMDDDFNKYNSLVKLKTLFSDHIHPKTDPGTGTALNPAKPWAGLAPIDIGWALINYVVAIRNTWSGMTPGPTVEPFWAPNYDATTGLSTHVEIKTTGPPVEYWGRISHRNKDSDGQTGAFENLMRLYNEICFTHNGATSFNASTPTQADLESYLDSIKELHFGWYKSGEKHRNWIDDFCRDIIRGTTGTDSIVIDDICADVDLISKLGLTTPDLNDFLTSKLWLRHPVAMLSTGGTSELPEFKGGSLEDSKGVTTAVLKLSRNDVVSIIQPFNCIGYFSVTVIFQGTTINVVNNQTRYRRINHPKAPSVTPFTGEINLSVGIEIIDVILHAGLTPNTGDTITLLISGKNGFDDETERYFRFELS
jgi:hypothetical protein